MFHIEVSLTDERHTRLVVSLRGGKPLVRTFPKDWLNLVDEPKWRKEVEKMKQKLRKGE